MPITVLAGKHDIGVAGPGDMLKILTELVNERRRYPGAPPVNQPTQTTMPQSLRREPRAVDIQRQYNTQSGAKR